MAGTDKRLMRMRLMGDAALIEAAAEKMVGWLEDEGHLVLEWTRPFPCRPPDESQSRIYISARLGAAEDCKD